MESLTGQQVRDIFSGKITRWSEVGGSDEPIQVWQRPVDSGSQTVMLAKVMKQTPMLPAKETEVARGMGRVIREVADYQNTNRSIGYTFRYYATQMNSDKGIKLLAINGIYPSEPNIRNGSYPYSTDVYMVTRENPTPETQKIVDWFISPQGQLLVQNVGYVPLYPMTE
ncbi:Phosphate-binding protein PstS 1 [Klebsiella spallanzanii]|uniref:Phosphate-binding protein PstS 1 n=1 Tax=Klebsiella spallanzanii TaxID=2587528 RepID=A0ABY6VEC3_9ENTR|nr:Phosphate-binding protein PstS 1 [Klebsiella spallanzanii]